MKQVLILFILNLLLSTPAISQTLPCDVIQISPNANNPIYYSPDSTQYFISKQDSVGGVFQIYVGNAGDTNTVCISDTYVTGNCCGLFRHWKTRNKVMVQWHASGDYIICGVEKEFYNELLFVPYNLRLGWIQSGSWLDIWAVKPDGSQWFNLANTEAGMTGPSFTPDGNACVYAEALDSSNLAVDVFGVWKFRKVDFNVNASVPSFANNTDISPAGARWLEPGNFSPDGNLLLFNSDIGMSNAEGQDQYILNLSNGNVTNLTNSPMIWDEHGVFSPDGQKILFMSSYPYQSDTNSYHTLTIKTEFMLINTDGTGLQQLTHFREPGYVESSLGIAATGFWTPNGSRIYCQSLVFPDYENWIIDFYGNCGNAALSLSENPDRSPVSIYPNPAKESVFIRLNHTVAEPLQIQLFNSQGMLINAISIEQDTPLSISDLPQGLYYLSVKNEDGKYLKFIKE